MTERQPHGALKDLSPDKVKRNSQNPRLFFRSEEAETLMTSIRRYGIQVPITVYEEEDHFVLIDGERRWRCALKLNLKRIPALVQPKPTELNNLLLMFNIHALREQWDYLTIANKLPEVINLYKLENGDEDPNEQDLSELTGLTRGQIRRCRLLFSLPPSYRRMLEKELELPKQKQRLSEDFFIEMERSLKTIQNRLPSVVSDMNDVRDSLIKKFRDKTINNITDFRKLSKIATSVSTIGIQEQKARRAISQIFNADNGISIDEIFAEQFETRYDERKIGINIDSIYEYLDATLESNDHTSIGPSVRSKLLNLREMIERVLGADDAI